MRLTTIAGAWKRLCNRSLWYVGCLKACCYADGTMPSCESSSVEDCWLVSTSYHELKIEESLAGVLDGKQLSEDLPRLSKYWEDLSHEEAEDCHFQGQPQLESWLVVSEEKVKKYLRQVKKRCAVVAAVAPNMC